MDITYLPLERWNRKWNMNGLNLCCRTCNATQDQAHATRPFVHDPQCQIRSSDDEYPLRELYLILRAQISGGLA